MWDASASYAPLRCSPAPTIPMQHWQGLRPFHPNFDIQYCFPNWWCLQTISGLYGSTDFWWMDIDESSVWPPRCKGDSYYLTPKHSCELNCEELSYFRHSGSFSVVPGGVTDLSPRSRWLFQNGWLSSLWRSDLSKSWILYLVTPAHWSLKLESYYSIVYSLMFQDSYLWRNAHFPCESARCPGGPMVGGTCQKCVNNCKNCYTESWRSDFSAEVIGVESDRGFMHEKDLRQMLASSRI